MKKIIHPKLTASNERMIFAYPFYGETFLQCNVIETEQIPTMGVNATVKGFNFYYNTKFVDTLEDSEVRFVELHEIYHLLFDHPSRSRNFDMALANIAQDMIINTLIARQTPKDFATMPKDKEKNQNIGVFIPKEYTGPEIFEKLYEWLSEKRDEFNKNKQQKKQNGNNQSQQNQNGQGQGQGEQKDKNGQPQNGQGSSGEGEGEKEDGQRQENGDGNKEKNGKPNNGKGNGQNSDYGPYGKDNQDMASLEKILENTQTIEGASGCTLDKHLKDEVTEEVKRQMVEDVIQKMRTRGLVKGDMEAVLNALRKKKHDYLRELKSSVSHLKGTKKYRTYARPNRRGRWGVKGFRKQNTRITVLLDTSGSMHGYFDKVLNYIFQNDIEVNLIQCDAEIHAVENIKSKKQLLKMKIRGLGGTILQPGVDYIKKNFPKDNLCVLTDGQCDELNFAGFNKRILVITVDTEVKTHNANRIKQIVVKEDEV